MGQTWDHEDNLPYAYYIYYMWANIQVPLTGHTC